MSKVVSIHKRQKDRSKDRNKSMVFRALKALAIAVVLLMLFILISPVLLNQGEAIHGFGNSVSNPNSIMLLLMRFVIYAACIWLVPVYLNKSNSDATPALIRSVRFGALIVALIFELLFVQGGLAALIDAVI